MNVSIETLPNHRAAITVELEPERLTHAYDETYRELAQRAVIPGFRKGRAPRNVVERHLGKDTIRNEAEEHAVSHAWQDVLKEHLGDLDPYGQPAVEITQHDPFIFKATVSLAPSVTLGDYKAIRIAPELIAVTDDDVTEVLERLRNQNAAWLPVEHRTVREGDRVTVDIFSMVGGEYNDPAMGVTADVTPESTFVTKDFAMRLVDMEVGQQKQFDVLFPADHPNQAFADKNGVVSITMREIKEKHLSDVNDDFAKTLGYDTLEEVKTKVRDSIKEDREANARRRLEREILEEIARVSTIAYPEEMVEQELQDLIGSFSQDLGRQGIDMDIYLRATGRTHESLNDELRPDAVRRVRNGLILSRIYEAEAMTVDPADVDKEIERLAAASNRPQEVARLLASERNRASITNSLESRRLMDKLIATVTEGQEPVTRAAEGEAAIDDEGAKPADDTTPHIEIATH